MCAGSCAKKRKRGWRRSSRVRVRVAWPAECGESVGRERQLSFNLTRTIEKFRNLSSVRTISGAPRILGDHVSMPDPSFSLLSLHPIFKFQPDRSTKHRVPREGRSQSADARRGKKEVNLEDVFFLVPFRLIGLETMMRRPPEPEK